MPVTCFLSSILFPMIPGSKSTLNIRPSVLWTLFYTIISFSPRIERIFLQIFTIIYLHSFFCLCFPERRSSASAFSRGAGDVRETGGCKERGSLIHLLLMQAITIWKVTTVASSGIIWSFSFFLLYCPLKDLMIFLLHPRWKSDASSVWLSCISFPSRSSVAGCQDSRREERPEDEQLRHGSASTNSWFQRCECGYDISLQLRG